MRRPWLRGGPKTLSLKAQLYIWLLVPMLALIAASSWLAYASALEMAHTVFDRMLLGSARMIGESIGSEDGQLRAELPPAALENLQTGQSDRVYYRVDAPGEGLLAGASAFPRYEGALATEEWRSFDTHFHGEPLRVLAFAQPVYPFSPSSTVIIQVATTQQGQSALAWHIWLRSVWPQAMLLLAVAALGWFWVRIALAPVTRISAEVRQHRLESSELIAVDHAPPELRPLVRAINDYIARISQFVSERSRFISNAAHQLKTPITVLNTQLTVGLRSGESEQKQRALLGGYQSVQHCSRLIHQLLTLSSTEHALAPPMAPSPVRLVDLAREVLVDLAELAHHKGIDLGLVAGDVAPSVQGVPLLLRELIANLVDNAIRYTPEGGTVTVSLHNDEGGARLEVEDSGPGIPAHERERVFERFYRLAETSGQQGSGLGLSIVREIAMSCGAQVQLRDRPGGIDGLLVRVAFASSH
ncbi:MAG: sensor histidine kinase [Betaproteobacteria bacterium]|nr:MAG: sensor histidine kinase [Betaproteobacteria bacterium]